MAETALRSLAFIFLPPCEIFAWHRPSYETSWRSKHSSRKRPLNSLYDRSVSAECRSTGSSALRTNPGNAARLLRPVVQRIRQPELCDRLLQGADHSRTRQDRVGLNTCGVNATTMTRMRLPHPVARHHRHNPRPLWFQLISSHPSLAGRASRFLLNRRAILFPSSNTASKSAARSPGYP
jgi:hypothetical protein